MQPKRGIFLVRQAGMHTFRVKPSNETLQDPVPCPVHSFSVARKMEDQVEFFSPEVSKLLQEIGASITT